MPKKRSDESLLEIIRDYFRRTGECPSPKHVSNKDYQMMRGRFGNFATACSIALEMPVPVKTEDNPMEKVSLTNELHAFVKNYGRLPNYKDFVMGLLPPAHNYLRVFDCMTWPQLMEKLGFEPVQV